MTFPMIITLATFAFLAFCLFTKKLSPLIATGVSILILWGCGILSTTEVFANFTSSSLLSLIGMMVLSKALMKTDLLNMIVNFTKKSGGGEKMTVLLVMVIAQLLALFSSQTNALITLVPLAVAMGQGVGLAPTVLIYCIVVGASITLIPVPIGAASVGYLMMNQQLELLGAAGTIGMFDSRMSMWIPSILVLLFVVLGGYKLLPSRDLPANTSFGNMGGKLEKSTLPQWKQNLIYLIFVVTIVLVSIGRNYGISAEQATTTAAFLLVVLGLLDEREFISAINLNLVLMTGFMLAFISAVANSGLGSALGNLLVPVYGKGNVFLAFTVTYLFASIATQFMDNVALGNILTPVCVSAAVSCGLDPALILIGVNASVALAYCTPMGSSISMVGFQLGGYSVKEVLKFSLPILAIMIVASCVWMPIYNLYLK